jgi:hypothetical protein
MAVAPDGVDTKPESSWEKFINLGGWNGEGGKRPENDSRPKPKND